MFSLLWQWFLNLSVSNKITLICAAIPLVIAFVGGVFNLIQWLYNRAAADARKKLYYDSKSANRHLKQEKILFHKNFKLRKKFFRKMTIKEEGALTQPLDRVPHFRGSYLVTGEAGCGKSEVLRNDFHRTYIRQFWTRIFLCSKRTCYLSSGNLIELLKSDSRQKTFLDRISMAKLSMFYLYLDGVDEISDIYMEKLDKFLGCVRDNVQRVVFRFSCRTEFADKYLSQYEFDHKFRIEKWNRSQLQGLSELILRGLSGQNRQKLKETRNYIKGEQVSWNFIDSPLLLKLLIYIKLYSRQEFQACTNKYSFYSAFFETLITIYQRGCGKGFYDVKIDVIDKAAESVFRAYINYEKSIPYMSFLAPLIKEKPDHDLKTVCLAHETFYEYLVAYYYHGQLLKENLSTKVIDVMKTSYSNDYADFITAAISADSPEQQKTVMEAMSRLYGYTLEPELLAQFKKQFTPGYEYDFELLSYMNSIKAQSSRKGNPYLILKNEIVFRFGRFSSGIERDYRVRFLEFIYEKDINTGTVFDRDYFIAVLRRCCAISSSFLGGEKIELDYVRHMLDFPPYTYDENYDLANRSHTLVYYSDVPDSNIFTFRDNVAEYDWDFARAKRIERLAYELPDRLSDMTAKEKKKYYFRVFDIATIYTFIKSRSVHDLSQSEIKILKNCKIDFADMSEQRREMLYSLKEAILNLIQTHL